MEWPYRTWLILLGSQTFLEKINWRFKYDLKYSWVEALWSCGQKHQWSQRKCEPSSVNRPDRHLQCVPLEKTSGISTPFCSFLLSFCGKAPNIPLHYCHMPSLTLNLVAPCVSFISQVICHLLQSHFLFLDHVLPRSCACALFHFRGYNGPSSTVPKKPRKSGKLWRCEYGNSCQSVYDHLKWQKAYKQQEMLHQHYQPHRGGKKGESVDKL